MTVTKTQIGGAAATAAASSAAGSQSAGVESQQPANGQQVENPNAEAKGNSGSDGANGTDGGDGTRQRPTRAERRINQLTAKLKGKDSATEASDKLRTMLENPLQGTQIALPDRSEQGEITPEQYKEDIINAADQIVKIRLGEALKANNQALSANQLATRAVEDIETAAAKYPELNPDSEEYDPEFESFLAETFERSFKADPSYRFKDLLESSMKLRKGSTSNKTTTDKGSDARSNGAIKGGGTGNAKATKSVEEMTSAEYKEYLKSKNGR